MKSKVYFIDAKKYPDGIPPEKVKELCQAAGFDKLIGERDAVAVKMHFGEKEAKGVVNPTYVKTVVDFIKDKKGISFLTDTGTLYLGDRARAPQHIRRAILNGYGYQNTGAPIVIADGLTGMDFTEVKIDGDYYKKVRIANGIFNSDALLAVTHFKGHEVTGFGGAIKNLGMGCAARPGKLDMHSKTAPLVSAEKCSGCGVCINYCAQNAISIKDNGSSRIACIDLKKCIGCGYCLAVCPVQVLGLNWDEEGGAIQKKIAEYAFGSVKGKKAGYLNFILHITPICDCYKIIGQPFMQDVGIVASLDPVAIDKASIDLTIKAAGKDKFKELYPHIDYNIQLEHAEKMGMGSIEYELIEM